MLLISLCSLIILGAQGSLCNWGWCLVWLIDAELRKAFMSPTSRPISLLPVIRPRQSQAIHPKVGNITVNTTWVVASIQSHRLIMKYYFGIMINGSNVIESKTVQKKMCECPSWIEEFVKHRWPQWSVLTINNINKQTSHWTHSHNKWLSAKVDSVGWRRILAISGDGTLVCLLCLACHDHRLIALINWSVISLQTQHWSRNQSNWKLVCQSPESL